MNTLEHELRRALRPQPAPPDLASRVLAQLPRTAPQAEPRPARTTFRASTRWLAAAAAVALMATGSARYYAHRQTVAAAERAHKDLQLALQITGEKLAFVQQRLDTTQAGDDAAAGRGGR